MKPEYVLAYSATGHILAESIVALLKSFGISAFTSQESAGIAYGLTIGPLGEAKIYVLENQIQDAQKILEQMDRGELQMPSTENDLTDLNDGINETDESIDDDSGEG
ncbi:MAG TPA: DUF2007 domain-containing protein [Longilinea sp.]|nr:DUF2007 domain-containing protein [Longilinea sp.]